MLRLFSFKDTEGNFITVNLYALVGIIQPSILSGKKNCTILFSGIQSQVDSVTAESIKDAALNLTLDPTESSVNKRQSSLIS